MQWAWAVRNLERLIETLDFHGLLVGKLTLILEYNDGTARSDAVTFEAPTIRYDSLLAGTQMPLKRRLVAGLLYRMHFLASEL